MKEIKNSPTELVSKLQSEILSTVRVLRDKSFSVGFAESCTGGLLSSYFTELAGISDVYAGSIVSYDNRVKEKLLMVSTETLKDEGAVSGKTAMQMALGAQNALGVSVAVSITGIAGPSGGSVDKPVGTVFIAVAGAKSDVKVFEHHFDGERKQIQLQSCIEAVKHLNKCINN